jgi:hypothetical protein
LALGFLAFLVWQGWTIVAALILLVAPATLLYFLLRDLLRGLRGPPRLYVKPASLAAGATVLAAAIFVAGREGGPLGCPSRDGPEPRRVANAFLNAVLDDRDAEAERYVASGGLSPQRESSPRSRP